MSKRHSKHHRGLMAPVFGALHLPSMSVDPKNVIMGMGLGVVGASAARYAWNTFAPAAWKTKAADAANMPWYTADNFVESVGAIAAGAAAYFIGKKSAKAWGLAVGSAAAGLGVGVLTTVRQFAPPAFSGLQVINVGGQLSGIVAKRRGALNGIVQSSARQLPAATASRSHSVQMAAMRAMAAKRSR
jgi:hypothetical protein